MSEIRVTPEALEILERNFRRCLTPEFMRTLVRCDPGWLDYLKDEEPNE